MNIIDVLTKSKIVHTNGEARKLVNMGAIKVNDWIVPSEDAEIDATMALFIKKGKKSYMVWEGALLKKKRT